MIINNIANDNNYIHFLSKARIISLKSTNTKAKIGAIVVRNGKVISTGFNRLRYWKGNIFTKQNSSLHAEVDALRKIMGNTTAKKTSLFVYRELKNGNIAISKPCEYCMTMIEALKVKKIVYTIDVFPFYEVKYLGRDY